MSYDRYRVSVEALENGFKVEVPDMEEIAKKEAAAKKKGDLAPYLGDCTKSFAAKTVKEAIKIVTAALEKIPEQDYETAFDAAASKK